MSRLDVANWLRANATDYVTIGRLVDYVSLADMAAVHFSLSQTEVGTWIRHLARRVAKRYWRGVA
jgi:hypothetical protein